MCVCTIVAHNNAQNRPDNFPSAQSSLLQWCLCDGIVIISKIMELENVAVRAMAWRSAQGQRLETALFTRPHVTAVYRNHVSVLILSACNAEQSFNSVTTLKTISKSYFSPRMILYLDICAPSSHMLYFWDVSLKYSSWNDVHGLSLILNSTSHFITSYY